VDQVRLDSVIETADILKLDLQGYEKEALEGAVGLFDSLSAIVLEVEFIPYYENQSLFSDIDSFLCSHDFGLYNLFDLHHEPDGQLAFADAVYLKKPTDHY